MSNLFKNRHGLMVGGVQTLEIYKEGYCLKVNTVNGASNQIWVFCCDTQNIRDEWLDALRTVILFLILLIFEF